MLSKEEKKRRKAIGDKKYREEHKEELRAAKKKYHVAHRYDIIKKVSEWVGRNKARSNEIKRQWANGHRDYNRERGRKYRADNIESERARSIKYRTEHAVECGKRTRTWSRLHPEKIIAYKHKRKALEHSGGEFSAIQWKELCERFYYKCVSCGESKPLTVDHIVPLSKGGTNDIENIQPLCLSCNSRKHTNTIDFRNSG